MSTHRTMNTLAIDGDAIETPLLLGIDDLRGFDSANQIPDTTAWDAKRPGRGVLLSALLQTAKVLPAARYLTLHASQDDFHACVPLEPLRDRACLIYELDGVPLAKERGGPFRFLVRDYAACKTDEIDDCANVKFVDHIEISVNRGQDNRPRDAAEHAKLHRAEQ